MFSWNCQLRQAGHHNSHKTPKCCRFYVTETFVFFQRLIECTAWVVSALKCSKTQSIGCRLINTQPCLFRDQSCRFAFCSQMHKKPLFFVFQFVAKNHLAHPTFRVFISASIRVHFCNSHDRTSRMLLIRRKNSKEKYQNEARKLVLSFCM